MSTQQSQRREPQPVEAVAFEKWAAAMQGEFDDFLRKTWKTMNAARQGCWIADTEEVLLQARDRLGRRAYEKLLQLRIEAGQEAFSPSRPPPGLEKQGPQAGDAPDGAGAC